MDLRPKKNLTSGNTKADPQLFPALGLSLVAQKKRREEPGPTAGYGLGLQFAVAQKVAPEMTSWKMEPKTKSGGWPKLLHFEPHLCTKGLLFRGIPFLEPQPAADSRGSFGPGRRAAWCGSDASLTQSGSWEATAQWVHLDRNESL